MKLLLLGICWISRNNPKRKRTGIRGPQGEDCKINEETRTATWKSSNMDSFSRVLLPILMPPSFKTISFCSVSTCRIHKYLKKWKSICSIKFPFLVVYLVLEAVCQSSSAVNISRHSKKESQS